MGAAVDADDAAALIRPAVPDPGGTWADLGAGTGTFTRALATLLGPGGRVYAVDRDPRVVRALRTWVWEGRRTAAEVTPVLADFTEPLALHALDERLDGVLAANALHFVDAAVQAEVLARVAAVARPGGRLVLVEYEGRQPSRWVPSPVSLARFRALAREAGLADPTLIGTRPSAFGGNLYAALVTT